MSAFQTIPFYDHRGRASDAAEGWALLHERSLRELRWRAEAWVVEPKMLTLTDVIDQWKADVRESYADVIPLHGYSVKAPEEGV